MAELTASTNRMVDAAGDDVPTRLIETAIRLYGERGTQAVSTREIQRSAGVLNEAAVRYYFGGKPGLLDACLTLVNERFQPIAENTWKTVQATVGAGPGTVRDVITAFVMAMYMFKQTLPGGVPLLARMIHEEGEAGQDLLLKHFGSVVWRLEDQLREHLPDKSPEMLRLHVFLVINSTITGIMDENFFWRLPARPDAPDRYAFPRSQMAHGFIDFLAAGISARAEKQGR